MHPVAAASACCNSNESCWLNPLPSTSAAHVNQIKASLTVGGCVKCSSTIATHSDEVFADCGLIAKIEHSTITVVVLPCLTRAIMQEKALKRCKVVSIS